MPWNAVTPEPRRPVAFTRTRHELIADGWSARSITAGVRSGELLRPRNGTYLAAGTDPLAYAAARLGGRTTCVTELSRLGVFVLDLAGLHVHLPPTTSRTTSRTDGSHTRRHWTRLARQPHPASCSVEPFDAVLHAVRCQSPKAAVATLDSALRLGVIRDDELDELFALLPRRYRVLRRLLDPRAESGPESLMRLLLRRLGCRIEVQVQIVGVGRVDFLVDGWLIVECDSRAHHSGWAARRRDLRRDQEAARQGFTTYRAMAEDILWCDDVVSAAVQGLRRARRGSESRKDGGSRRS